MYKEYKVVGEFQTEKGREMVTVMMQSTGACCVMRRKDWDTLMWYERKNKRQTLLRGA